MVLLGAHKPSVVVVCCVIVSLFLVSCATPYRSLKHQSGYDEQQVGKDEYDVSFLGNGSSSYERALDFALLRAAEISLKQQAKSFIVLDVVNLSSARKYRTGNQFFWTTSPYLSTGGQVIPSAPEFTGGLDQSYLMVTPAEDRVFYKPGVRLRITLSPDGAPGGFVYDSAQLSMQLKRKYGLD